MSDLAYYRARRLRLIDEAEVDRQTFLDAIHLYLGCSGFSDCDRITEAMSDEDFERLIDAVKRRLKKKQVLDAYVSQYITVTPTGVA